MPSNRFSALLSPLRVRGKTMKTRFMYPVAQAHYIQGPEEYPADPVVQYYCSFARQGQSLIITQELTNLEQRQMSFGDQPHFALYDMDNPACQNYFTQLAYFIHFYGALCGFNLNYDNRLPYCINDPAKTTDIGAGGMGGRGGMPGGPGGMPGGPGGPGDPGGAPGMGGPGGPGGGPGMGGPGDNSNKVYLDEEHMVEYIDYMCKKTLAYQSFGYDAVHLEMAREFLMAKFLDPAQNHRDDEYGGSFENRIRFPVQLCKALREAVGENFIISTNAPSISLTEDRGRNALTISEAIEFMKAIEPYVDIVKLQNGNRGEDGVASMEGYELAKLLKAGGTKIKIAVNNPAMDLDLINRFVAEGVADVIASARMFIANDKLDEILRDGDADELNHCLGCSVCRGQSQEEDWMSHCTINPKLGMEHRLKEHITAPGAPKKIAIIGGGPAGMKCAITLAERGHQVTIFEKNDHLGGMIDHSRYASFKWPMLNLLKYFERKCAENPNITVHLDCDPDPEWLENQGFDLVIGIGGGKIFDTAKAVAMGIPYSGDVWEFFSKGTVPEQILPVGVISTISSSGSETSNCAILSNGTWKLGYEDDRIIPRFAILDPVYTASLPWHQIAAGIADILSHLLERYFSEVEHTDVTDYMIEGAVRALLLNAERLRINPADQDARTEIQWLASVAHNNFLDAGRIADWGSHRIEHELSAQYGIVHGEGMAVVLPAWLRCAAEHKPWKPAQLACRVWGFDPFVTGEKEAVLLLAEKLKEFFRSLSLRVSLTELGISSEYFQEMAERATVNGAVGHYLPLDADRFVEILELAI